MPRFEAKKGDSANIWQKLGATAPSPPALPSMKSQAKALYLENFSLTAPA